MKKIFNWVIDKWLAGFTTAGFFYLISIYRNLPDSNKENFFHFEWFMKVINHPIKLWIVFLVVVLILLLSRVKKRAINSKDSFGDVPQNKYSHYTSDIFGQGKLKWTWNYKWDSLRKEYMITNVLPSCPKCGTTMSLNASFGIQSANCHKCRLENGNGYQRIIDDVEDIYKEILRKINNNEI